MTNYAMRETSDYEVNFKVTVFKYLERPMTSAEMDELFTHMVRYNGTLYNITRIDTFEGYKEDLTLYCVAKK